jgi:hypothetical protein
VTVQFSVNVCVSQKPSGPGIPSACVKMCMERRQCFLSVEGTATLASATFFFSAATTLVRNKKDLAAASIESRKADINQERAVVSDRLLSSMAI